MKTDDSLALKPTKTCNVLHYPPVGSPCRRETVPPTARPRSGGLSAIAALTLAAVQARVLRRGALHRYSLGECAADVEGCTHGQETVPERDETDRWECWSVRGSMDDVLPAACPVMKKRPDE